MNARILLLTAFTLTACAPDATGNWQGSCWMTLNPAVFADPSTDLGPHEWSMVLELEEEDATITGDFDYQSAFDGTSANGDVEGTRGAVDLELTLEYIRGNDRGRFELEVEHDEEGQELSGDGALYNDKDNVLQANGDCDLEYRF